MRSTHRITRAAYLQTLSDFREFIKGHCKGKPGVTDEILYDIQLAVDEATTNVITHGYAGLDPGSIILDLEISTDQITVTLTDFGHSFEPGSVPPPDVESPLEERQPGGLGLFFIQHSVDEMEYEATEDGNKMILTRYLTNQAEENYEDRSKTGN